MKILTKKDIKLKDLRTESAGCTKCVFIEKWKNGERYKCYLAYDLGTNEEVTVRTYKRWKNTNWTTDYIKCICTQGKNKGLITTNDRPFK